MPELPEVETTLKGISPHLLKKRVTGVVIRETRLRWPLDANLSAILRDRQLVSLTRRAKYLLFAFSGERSGTLLVHLGMSGSLRLVAPGEPPRKHDHLDIVFERDDCLRFHDPRRFGAVLWIGNRPYQHKLLRNLGPEPLAGEFDGRYLHRVSRGRKLPVKQLLMDNRVVVGVGNIYASEALFRAGVSPVRGAGNISLNRYNLLAIAVKDVLAGAIEQGGTTLRDFVNGQGRPGYFKQSLRVYGRGGLPCRTCKTPLKEIRLGQRSTVYCSACQR